MILACSLLLAQLAAAAPPPADLVLTGAAVYTVDAARSWAQSVGVRDGKIVFVGTDAGVKPLIGPTTRVVRLEGRMVVPGFQDAHVHPISGGIELGQCNLNEPVTAQAILDKVRVCAAERKGAWLQGGGWSLTAFPGGNPKKDALDEIVRDRPALLSAADGHSAWVNSKALEMAGITAATRDPQGGRIERDAAGAPSGTLREEAVDLVDRLIPQPTPAERLAGLKRALDLLNRNGVTAVQEADAGGGGGGGADGGEARPTLETYRAAEREGTLSVRVVAALTTDPARGVEQVDELASLRREFASPRVHPVAAKIFADGVIEARTAAMLEPYLDRPDSRGEPNFPADRLNALVTRLAAADFNVHIHAIGDRAVRMSLDAFEAARSTTSTRRLRHQIAHLEVIDPEDVPRFHRLGVIANFQALWAFADDYIVDLTWPALGPDRSRWIYPIGSIARSGAVLAFGSDWSVSSLNPLDAIQVALTRQALGEPRRPPMVAEEAIDLPTALAAYTIGSAYANGLEAETGSIELGKSADLVVLSANLFDVPTDEIHRQKVLLTLLDGRPVYRDPELAW